MITTFPTDGAYVWVSTMMKRGAEDEGDELSLNDITTLVNANWHFGAKRRWYLNLGPYVGFLTSADVNDTDAKNQLKDTDIGVNTGIGVKIKITLRFFRKETVYS